MNPRKIIHMGNIDTIQRQRRMEGRKDDIDAELDRVIREQDTEDDSTQSNAYNVSQNIDCSGGFYGKEENICSTQGT